MLKIIRSPIFTGRPVVIPAKSLRAVSVLWFGFVVFVGPDVHKLPIYRNN